MRPNFSMEKGGKKARGKSKKAGANKGKGKKAQKGLFGAATLQKGAVGAFSGKKIRVPVIEPKKERGGEVKYSSLEFLSANGAGSLKKLAKIGRGSLIELIVLKYPQLIEDLSEAGMHCIGCPVAAFETLYDGCVAHGMNEAQIDKLIEKLNKKISKNRKIEKNVN